MNNSNKKIALISDCFNLYLITLFIIFIKPQLFSDYLKIALICSTGISTNRILDKINDVIVKNNYDMQFFVITPGKLDNNYNIFLLAPQVEYLSIKVVATAKNSKVAVLPS